MGAERGGEGEPEEDEERELDETSAASGDRGHEVRGKGYDKENGLADYFIKHWRLRPAVAGDLAETG